MNSVFDVIVAGGSIAGLLAAREAAQGGFTVAVLEEDLEIGVPEKCGGLVSIKGLNELGVLPSQKAIRATARRALFYSPEGLELEIPAAAQNVVVLDRRQFDRELAEEAQMAGAEILVGQRVTETEILEDSVKVSTNRGHLACSVFVDARGAQGLAGHLKSGVLQAAQYEAHAQWIEGDTVQVYIDQEKTPGFFTWVIPLGERTARVGAAGRGVNGFNVIDSLLEKRGGTPVKKLAAPVAVSGPLERFVEGRVVLVGDAAGQSKPTTAGGIYTSGLGGLLAGQAIVHALSKKDLSALGDYERVWRSRFGREFHLTLVARRIFESMGNKHVEALFEALGDVDLTKLSEVGWDFDHHSTAILSLIGVRKLAELMAVVAGAEVSKLFSLLRSSSKT